jgi:uncharacterized membrane protein HdeD (DUF308 family)
MNTMNQGRQFFRKPWVFAVLSLLALILATYLYFTQSGDFKTLALITSASILVAGILKIIFSRANHKLCKTAGWYSIGGTINIILSAVFFFDYFTFYQSESLSNTVFLVFIGFWLMMHSFLNFSFSYELNNLDFPAVLPLIIVGIIGSLASIAVIIYALAEPESALPVMAGTLLVISIYNCWLYFYTKKNPIRNFNTE